jgi:hypothetical protein
MLTMAVPAPAAAVAEPADAVTDDELLSLVAPL